MARLLNNQYTQFVLDHVVRPYQGTLGIGEIRAERLVFDRTNDPAAFNYAELIVYSNTRADWYDLVIDRLSRCYEAIDFSFFPNEAFAQQLQKSLIAKGVKPLVYFNDSIYAA